MCTQRYNRLEKTDGPLFRGRYKAILIEADCYFLNVSRYIHLNPVVAGMVSKPTGTTGRVTLLILVKNRHLPGFLQKKHWP